jgi:hypothetical protein
VGEEDARRSFPCEAMKVVIYPVEIRPLFLPTTTNRRNKELGKVQSGGPKLQSHHLELILLLGTRFP